MEKSKEKPPSPSNKKTVVNVSCYLFALGGGIHMHIPFHVLFHFRFAKTFYFYYSSVSVCVYYLSFGCRTLEYIVQFFCRMCVCVCFSVTKSASKTFLTWWWIAFFLACFCFRSSESALAVAGREGEMRQTNMLKAPRLCVLSPFVQLFTLAQNA